jgi:hypothetical protein
VRGKGEAETEEEGEHIQSEKKNRIGIPQAPSTEPPRPTPPRTWSMLMLSSSSAVLRWISEMGIFFASLKVK